MINLHENMGSGRDQTQDPWICSQTRRVLSGYIVFASVIKLVWIAFEYLQQLYKKQTKFSEQELFGNLMLESRH